MVLCITVYWSVCMCVYIYISVKVNKPNRNKCKFELIIPDHLPNTYWLQKYKNTCKHFTCMTTDIVDQ
jgi:hypothetical protein